MTHLSEDSDLIGKGGEGRASGRATAVEPVPVSPLRDGIADAAHTSGPWTADPINSWNVWARDCKVANLSDIPQSPAYREPSKAERIANARLIAAAPDMLEVVREAYHAGLLALDKELWSKARAALAKAGEA